MEYLVLARKWRPQTFTEVVGQEHVARTLTNAIRQNRVAHSFIFSGPRGVGKTSMARILAKALNCTTGPTPTPCQKCDNCREITAGTSLDVREIDGASNRGIDEIRELRENVKFSPTSGHYKIYIIDEVHMLTREAFNALLKTLEEPPGHVIFIFATTELHKIPATILSRCQAHDFRMIPLKQITETLREIAKAENIAISDAGLAWIAAAGRGSLRDAQSVFDQAISYAGSEIKDSDVEELLCLTDRRFLFLLSAALLQKQAARCLKIINEGYAAGLDMKHFYQLLLEHFRNLLFIKIVGPDPALFDITGDDLAELQSQAANPSRETLQRLLDILLAEEESMRRTQEPRLHLEATIVRMAHLEELIPLEEILGRMENIERGLQRGITAPTGAAPEGLNPPGKPSPADNTSVALPQTKEDRLEYQASEITPPASNWERYKAAVKKHRRGLASNLDKGNFVSCHEGVLTISFTEGDRFTFEYVREKEHLASLAELARPFFGEDVRLKIEFVKVDTDEQTGKNGSTGKSSQEVRQEALNHPLVQKAFDLFEGAEVRDIIPHKNT